MSRKLISLAVTFGVVAFLFPAGPAAGQAAAIPDPDDVGGSLDISQISYAARYGEDQEVTSYRFEIKTHDKWRCRYLNKAHDTTLNLKWHDRGDRRADLVGRFRCMKGEVWLFMGTTDGEQNFEPLRARHPRRRVVSVIVPEAAFQGGFRTWARSVDAHHDDCLEAACIDRAPDQGRM